MSTEFKLASARIGPFLISGEVEVEFDHEVTQDTIDVSGYTRTIDQDVELFDVELVQILAIDIDHPDWDTPLTLTADSGLPSLDHWTETLAEQSDEWWSTEICDGPNDIWQWLDN